MTNLDLAQAALGTDPAQAEQLARQVLANDPANPQATLVLSAALRRQNKVQAAIEHLTACLERMPLPALWCECAACYFDVFDIGAALNAASTAIVLDPDCVPAYELRVELYSITHQWDEALADIDAVIEKGGETAERLQTRAQLRSILRDRDGQYEDICRAVELNPNDAKLRQLKASEASDRDDFELALLEYQAAVELDPKDEEAFAWYVTTMFYCDRFEEALALCEQRQLADPSARLSLLLTKGSCLYNLGRYQEALGPHTEVVQSDRTDRIISLTERAECYLRLGRPAEALKDLKQCLRIEYADIPRTCLLIGVALLALNRPKDAVKTFTQAIDETGLDETRALAYLGRSKAHSVLGKNAQALADAAAARQVAPEVVWNW